MKVTLGGDRLGSGNKNKIALRNYERSTHNLSQKFTSSMQVGTLYPFLVLPAMRGDKFTIDLDADARTIPTKGPLFGSFKMQVDLFQCDVRLYQAILHNNPLAIGLKMNRVQFPNLAIRDTKVNDGFSNTCLMKYLGMSGIGTPRLVPSDETHIKRFVNAIPALAYYEIFKTYYSNKQEENAYIITDTRKDIDIVGFQFVIGHGGDEQGVVYEEPNLISVGDYFYVQTNEQLPPQGRGYEQLISISYLDNDELNLYTVLLSTALQTGWIKRDPEETNKYYVTGLPLTPIAIKKIQFNYGEVVNYTINVSDLAPFKLANIDEMRLKLLSHHTLGLPFVIKGDTDTDAAGVWDLGSGEDEGLPYVQLVKVGNRDIGYRSLNSNNMNGLVLKTYQSDLFNNWVNTDWIDGENGIANITAISTSSGKIQIDTINLSEKLYNMLNRVAVSDGSYEGWQDAVYTETPKRHIESPVYLGGMSSEIMFEEIVQTSQGDDNNPLGTLGGKGKLIKRKGGHVTVKVNEAAFIIGIVSLTPRINYAQGNEFYLTELMSMDDFHKPALDGIGFQDLVGERLAWWDTKIDHRGVVIARSKIGKLPAWIEYMTAVDKCYGDFAETDGKGFMNLLREYNRTNNNEIGDATTYIDPRKYNYAFANTAIDAQNFWVQIYSKITARRLMSAKQIPNI